MEYQLEQEKAFNAELMKEVDSYKDALQEAQEKVDPWDMTTTEVEARIKDLELVAEAKKDFSNAHEKIKHLREELEEE